MKTTIRKLLKTAGKRLGLDKLIWCVYELLQEPTPAVLPLGNEEDEVIGFFTDSFGDQIELIAGLRDRLKPGWQMMLRPPKASVPLSPKACLANIEAWRERLDRVDGFLRTSSLSFAEKEVLEIGASDGATAYALAEAGAKNVVATDLAAYYITQSPNGVVCEDAIGVTNADLAGLRDAYRISVDEQTAQRVSFREDDVCSSSLRSESADAVMSWEVLEHLTRPEDAFRQIARILRPGGFAFHEYNPFFSMNGGHSLCTLDFLWGHARLHGADFERYLEETRPSEKAVALSFYQNNLNRMTLSGLRHYAQQSGLTLVSLLPWCSEDHLALASSESLSQCSRVYPSAELVDLISPTVWVLLRKNGQHVAR